MEKWVNPARKSTREVAARSGVEVEPRTTLDELLRLLRDDKALPRDAGDLFHFIRRVGNVAIHENVGSTGDALTALKTAWQLSTQSGHST